MRVARRLLEKFASISTKKTTSAYNYSTQRNLPTTPVGVVLVNHLAYLETKSMLRRFLLMSVAALALTVAVEQSAQTQYFLPGGQVVGYNPYTGSTFVQGFGVSPFSGTYFNTVNQFNRFNGTFSQGVQQFNPFTGTIGTSQRFYNPYLRFGGVNQYLYNPFLGNRYANFYFRR